MSTTDSNIITELNKVLSEEFGCTCLFKDFNAYCTTLEYYGQYVQGLYCSSLTFHAVSNLENENYNGGYMDCKFDASYGDYLVEAILVKDSQLRKKILEVMLAFN